MSIDIQQMQQALLAANDTQGAALLSDPFTEIALYPASFLQKYRIYRVLYHSPYKPVLLYLGFAPNLPHYWLANNPQAFRDLARADQVDLVTPGVAITYATVFLEVTRDMSVLVYLVKSVDEIQFLPTPTPEEAQVADALREKYRWVITPPSVRVIEDEYSVKAYVIRQQELECHTLRITKTGDVQSEITILERKMPTVIGI